MLPHAPGIQQQNIPEDAIDQESDDEDKQDPDERISIRASEKRIAKDEEFSDSEDEGDGRRDVRTHKPTKPKKAKVDGDMSVDGTPEKEKDEKCKEEEVQEKSPAENKKSALENLEAVSANKKSEEKSEPMVEM